MQVSFIPLILQISTDSLLFYAKILGMRDMAVGVTDTAYGTFKFS